jgi:hypothetical protein
MFADAQFLSVTSANSLNFSSCSFLNNPSCSPRGEEVQCDCVYGENITFQSHICYDKACVCFSNGQECKLSTVVSYLVYNKPKGDFADSLSWKFKKKFVKSVRLEKRMTGVLSSLSYKWRARFAKSVFDMTGKNVNFICIDFDGHKNATISRSVERDSKYAFMDVDFQSMLTNDIVFQADYGNIDISLDVASVILTHTRSSSLEGELNGFLDVLLISVEAFKSMRNAKSWFSVYSTMCYLARMLGFTSTNFLNMCGVSIADNKLKFSNASRPADAQNPIRAGSFPPYKDPEFITSKDSPVEIVEEEDVPKPKVVDIGGGIFVEDDGQEVVFQAKGMSDVPKVMHNKLYVIFNSIFGVSIAVALHRLLKGALEPSVLLNVTRDSIKNFTGDIIETVSSVFSAMASFDFWTALDVFKKGFFGEDATEVAQIGRAVSDLAADVNRESTGVCIELYLHSKKITEVRARALVVNKPHVVKLCDDVSKMIEETLSTRKQRIAMSSVKAPPPIFIGCGDARSGKSLIPQCIIAALGSLYELSENARCELTYYPQNMSKYYEGFADWHRHVHWDEAGSIDREIDTCAGERYAALLDFSTPISTGLNMAFAGKGTTNTNNVRVLSVNTNSSVEKFVSNFTQPDAIYGRAYFVTVVPGDAVKDRKRFNPLMLEEKNVESLNSNVNFIVKRYYGVPHGAPEVEVVYCGDMFGFIKYVYDLLLSGLSGERAEVARMFKSVTHVTVKPSGKMSFPKTTEGVILSGEVPKVATIKNDLLFNKSEFVQEDLKNVLRDERKEFFNAIGLSNEVNSKNLLYVDLKKDLIQEDLSGLLDIGPVDPMHGEWEYEEPDKQAFFDTIGLHPTIEFQSKIVDRLKFFNPINIFSRCCHTCQVQAVEHIMDNVSYDIFMEFWNRWKRYIGMAAKALLGSVALYTAFKLCRIPNEVRKIRDVELGPLPARVFGNEITPQIGMPRPLEGDPDEDDEVTEWRGKLFSTKSLDVEKAYMVPLFGGSLGTPQGYAKIERNVISVSVSYCIKGVWSKDAVNFGYCFNGNLLTVGHPIHPDSESIRVSMESAMNPRGTDCFELSKGQWRFIPGCDLVVFPCHIPSGIKDLKKQLSFKEPKVGDRVILLGAYSKPRLEGVVQEIHDSIFKYHGEYDIYINKTIVTSITGTQDGDCGRLLLVVRDKETFLCGMHFAMHKPTKRALSCGIPIDFYTRYADDIKPQSFINEDISLVGMLHPEQVVEGLPEHGVFASPYFVEKQKLLPVLGLSQNSRPGKSRLKPTPFFEVVDTECNKFGVKYRPAELKSQFRWDDDYETNRLVSPYEYALSFDKIQIGCPRYSDLVKCHEGIISLSGTMEASDGPVGLDESLHGVGIMKPVAPGTGAGYHIPGKKGDFIWEVTLNDEVFRVGGQELREGVNLLFSTLARGEIPPGISKIALKDEALKFSKVESMSTRTIHVVSIDEYVLGRMLLAKTLSVVYTFLQKTFGMCFVVNAHGPDWEIIYERSVKIAKGFFLRLGADFKAYDLHHMYTFMYWALQTLYSLIMRAFNWPKVFRKVIMCYLWMKVFRVVCVDGVWVQAFFGGPSGDILTVYLNCMCQLYYWFVCWSTVRGSGDFSLFMQELGNYWNSLGDDCSLRVSVDVSKWFTCDKIVSTMLFRCGQVITGDGSKDELKYGGEGEFLKRTFREMNGHIVAPLHVNSLLKMLLYYEEKTLMNPNYRFWCLLSVVWEEAYFHDDEKKKYLRELVLTLKPLLREGYDVKPFRDDQTLWESYLSGNLGLWDRIKDVDVDVQFQSKIRSVGLASGGISRVIKVQEKANVSRFRRLARVDGRSEYSGLPHREKRNCEIWSSHDGYLGPTEHNNNDNVNSSDRGNGDIVSAPVITENPGEDVVSSVDDARIGTATYDTTFQLVSSMASGPPRLVIPVGEPALTDDEFFGRPVLITTIDWTDSPTFTSFNAHSLWFNNAMVLQRMKGWQCAKWEMVLRFEYSPSFYHYGLARIYFFPLWSTIGTTVGLHVQHTVARGSQMHGVWIDAAQPGVRELVIPWCHYYDAFEITTAGSVAGIGQVFFAPGAAPLARSDSVTTGTVKINVRAYARNVVRTGPTRLPLAAQSSSNRNINGTMRGVIARTTENFGKGFRTMSEMPIVSGFANAAAGVLEKASSIADKFGWSRPLELAHIRSIPRPPASAPCAQYDDSYDLGFMPDRGILSPPSNISCVSEDEMSIMYIARHESLVGKVTWDTSSASLTSLINVRVHPMLGWYDSTTNATTPSAIGWVSGSFRYWRGTIVYSFRVVCSNQHAGSIRITYDPGSGSIGDFPNEAARTCVLEVKPGATAEISVGWSSVTPWLRVRDTYLNPQTDYATAGDYNGTLSVEVYNPLNSPLDSQAVTLLVSMKAGDDFRLMYASELPNFTLVDTEALRLNSEDIVPQSLVCEKSVFKSEDIVFQSALITNVTPVTHCKFGAEPASDELVSRNSMGEMIHSTRALLKRYQYFGYLVSSGAGTAGATNKTFSTVAWMHEPCFDNGTLAGTALNPLTLTGFSHFRWLKCAFAGHRGGARYRVRPAERILAGVDLGTPWFRVSIDPYAAAEGITTSNSAATLSGQLSSEVYDGFNREYCDFIVPDYSMFRYVPGFLFNPDITTVNQFMKWELHVTRPVSDATTANYFVTKAIDEDFSFVLFIGAPVGEPV